MKTQSNDFIAEETGQKRKPIELYHFWRAGGTDWYYTSHDKVITYGGEDYNPAVITRGTAKYDSQFEVTRLTVQFNYLDQPAVDYIAQNPVELIWIEVRRYHEDVTPEETSIVFIGQIKSVAFEGNLGKISCVGFEHFLRTRVPIYRYQIGCNNDLFDSRCQVTASSYTVNTTITAVDTDGVELTSTDFALQDDGWYTRGYIKWGDYYRMIVDHTGSVITIRFKMPGFTSGQSIDAWAGCDKQITTCIDKFSNQLNFFGHPYIPLDNPVSWVYK